MGSSAPLVAAFFVAAVAACCPERAPSSRVQAQVVQDPAKPPTYTEELALLDPYHLETPVRAVLVWRRHHENADPSTRMAGLVELRKVFAEVERVYETRLDEFPPPLLDVAELELHGILLYAFDGERVHVDAELIERNAGAMLLPEERRWLRAIEWDEDHVTRMEGDYPSDLVRSMAQWEGVIDDGEPWASWGRRQMSESLEMYLVLCVTVQQDEPTSCPITRPMWESYAELAEKHRSSRINGAVAHFFAGAKRKGFELSLEELDTLTEEAVQRVTADRPAV